MSNIEENGDDRKFLTDWLIKSAELLGDNLEQLERMTLDELAELAKQRQQRLREVGDQKIAEAKALSLRSGIRGVAR